MPKLYHAIRFGAAMFAAGYVTAASLQSSPMAAEAVAQAETLFGLEFTPEKRELMLEGLKDRRAAYERNRGVQLSVDVPPALLFNPVPVGKTFETEGREPRWSPAGEVTLPDNLEEIAFYSIGQLAELIRTRQVTSEQLTRLYLDRLKRHGPKLECVITLTEDLALEQARRADRELADGIDRGLLHGIPYGAKDLLATRGIPTTWGSPIFKDQVFDEDATVIGRLEEAGAVLVAKLTLGELAWGDVWHGGMTRNPWNVKAGSSGSSAGSAAATAAGLVAFSIGSETWGSIVSPASTCGVTGLRPTYGRVSGAGAMPLAWSMDKIGPMARTVEDCAIVFHAIYGPDNRDPRVVDLPFNYRPDISLSELRIGYLKRAFENAARNRENDAASLEKLEELGASLIPIELPEYPVGSLSFVLSTEGAAVFDQLTRSGRDDLMVRQVEMAWPNVFRAARFVPAVEYLQANRIRHLLVQEMGRLMEDIDVYVAPTFGSDNLLLTNLTGHPCIVVPNGFIDGMPASITFIGRLYGEAELLAVAKAYQDATEFHRPQPPLFAVGAGD